MQKIRENYTHSIYACYIGYITQAVINNFAPLLFLTFQQDFQISLDRIALIVTANFGIQLLVDLLAARYVDRIGYRKTVVAAHLFAAAGLIGLAVFPCVFPSAYAGILTAAGIYAVGGGLIEVLISPIVEACPTKAKEAAMSLLHSFYCWGHVGVVLLSTLFFALAGIQNWRMLAVLWAVIPLANAVYFTQVPIARLVEEGEGMSIGALFQNKMFWVLFVLMVCSGASEQGMSQWASAFAEAGLKVSKTVGDLAGPCAFALCMGSARALYAKWSDRLPLEVCMTGSGILCVCSYLLAAFAPHPVLGLIGCSLCGFSVGVMWPGTFSMAAKSLRGGGTALFALLALSGDLGCFWGPGLVGYASELLGEDLKKGILAAILFPVCLLAALAVCVRMRRKTIES